MFIVTNTIHVKKEYAEKIFQRFASPVVEKNMATVPGFVTLELLQRTLPTDQSIVELIVLSKWQTKESQKNWLHSSSFKQMHQKSTTSKESATTKQSTSILSSTIAEYNVVTSK